MKSNALAAMLFGLFFLSVAQAEIPAGKELQKIAENTKDDEFLELDDVAEEENQTEESEEDEDIFDSELDEE